MVRREQTYSLTESRSHGLAAISGCNYLWIASKIYKDCLVLWLSGLWPIQLSCGCNFIAATSLLNCYHVDLVAFLLVLRSSFKAHAAVFEQSFGNCCFGHTRLLRIGTPITRRLI